jgi:two-component system chemotaxis response regulator CheB
MSEIGKPGYLADGNCVRQTQMEVIRIIVVSASGVERSRITRALSGRASIQLIAMAADQPEAFTLIEATEPDIVLFAQVFCDRSDFDGMLDLLRAVDAQWISLHGPGACCPRRDSPATAWDRSAPAHAVQCLEDLLERVQNCVRKRPRSARMPSQPAVPDLRGMSDKIVLIGASTGGIDALLTVLAAFPPNCPPTAIVQHTGRGFSQSLVRLLDKRCAAKVVAAEDGLPLEPGMVTVAGGVAGHLRLHAGKRLVSSLLEGPEVCGQLPSIDVLFRSAVPFADRCIAVLLTGMGSDGAAGLLELRRAGSFTIGQDEATSVVYGMPRIAHEIGGVRQQLPLSRIGAAILQLSRSGHLALN